MVKIFTLTVMLLSLSFPLFPQAIENNPDEFDRAFLNIYMHKAGTDISSALKSADSLYRASIIDIHKIRSLMLISDVYHRMANRDSSIYYAEQAGRLADRSNNYNWQARIYGVLSTQHRETGLLKQGQQYLTKGLRASEKITDPNTANQFKGHVYQEMGFYSMAEEEFSQAIPHFKQAEVYFQQLPESPNKHLFLAQNEERLGVAYLKLETLDSANYHFSNALVFNDAIPQEETPLKGFIYNGLGQVNLAQGKQEEAFDFLRQAEEVAAVTQFPNLKIDVFRSLARYYEAAGNMEAYARYNEQYLEAIKDNLTRHRSYADNVVTKTQTRLERATASLKNTLLFVCLLALIATVGIGAYVKKQRQDRARFKAIINRLTHEKQQVVSPTINQITEDKEIMPEATRLDLLKKLERFETGDGFTDKNISIAVLAGKFKTNTKYLSHVINKHKQKDFNTYINELRIDYIITKMGNDARYLTYKISYLADECGFATHSQFATVFKQVTGLSPSVFINYLKKDRQKEESSLVG